MQEKIISKDISVVVQGPIHKIRTKKCLKSIRNILPDAEIILSTWDGSNIDGLEYDILIMNETPIAIQQKNITTTKLYNNLNRMILSTNKGLEKASRKYILKLRTDSILDNSNFISYFDAFQERSNEYKLFTNRIIASTLFSRFAINKKNKTKNISFHISDWWFFGLAEDVKKYLYAAESVQEPYFSTYFEQPENRNKDSVYDKFTWKFSPEQYLGYSCFSKYFDDIRMQDCADESEEINEKSRKCLANNFIFLDYKKSGIRNQKYYFSKLELLCGEQYLNLYNFYTFETEYKKYCSPDYAVTIDNSMVINKEYGFRVLRFYKHLYKLFDNETPLRVKFEQLFIGIPFSGITLLPAIFKMLMAKR